MGSHEATTQRHQMVIYSQYEESKMQSHAVAPHAVERLPHVATTDAQPDDAEPSPERQAELRAAYAANVAAGKAPYADVRILTRGELLWVMRERGWSGKFDAYTVKYVIKPRGETHEHADLSGVNLSHVCLRDVCLRIADLSGANLVFADLRGAHLADANFSNADMGRINLSAAELRHANLSGAHMREADLSGANAHYSNLQDTRLHRANLKSTILHGARMDPATVLSDVTLDSHTWLGDVIWNGVSLARIDWDQVPRLGDEDYLRIREEIVVPNETPESSQPTSVPRITAYLDAARAYHQLANALQSQGLSEPAGRYAYRAQVLERKAYLRKGKLGRWFFSLLLGLVAGYGYRMGRIIIAYLLVVGCAAGAYYLCGVLGFGQHFSPSEALLVSVTAFHGRVFSGQLGFATPQAWVAAVEAVLGLLIEGVFVAMLTQRFFGK